MAVTKQKSDQLAKLDAFPVGRNNNIDILGKLRTATVSFTQSGAGDANSEVEIAGLPHGRVRVVGHLSKLKTSAFGAGRTLDVGLSEFETLQGATTAEVQDQFVDGEDVNAATSFDLGVDALTIVSKRGATIKAKVLGGTIPDGATITGTIVFAIDS